MSKLLGRWATWLRNRLRGWLGVTDPIPEWKISSIAQESYRVWQRRFEQDLKDREKQIAAREAQMERLAAETMLAVEKTITEIQLAKQNWQAVVESQEADKKANEQEPH